MNWNELKNDELLAWQLDNFKQQEGDVQCATPLPEEEKKALWAEITDRGLGLASNQQMREWDISRR